MSAFFVHDLKNAAASLNLMLKNLPMHFDDPAFREDALRGIGNTARRIDEMIGRLSALRQRPDVRPVEADLNQLVSEVLDRLNGMPHVELTKELQPLPRILADREQIQSAVTNLVLNARDALGPGGRIGIRTEHAGGSVVLSVTDNGCGMSAAFLKDSLFRPFQSTKKKGLGIGMFQSRMIVEAHGGTIRVESEAGKGSTFRVSLPVKQGVMR
jgi:signal transduction histidine kinase